MSFIARRALYRAPRAPIRTTRRTYAENKPGQSKDFTGDGAAEKKVDLREGAKRDPELYILLAIMTSAFGLAGWHFSSNPTSSSSENKVAQAVDSEPWKTGGTAKYQYHPHGDPSKGRKDAPSALNEVIIPNVNLPKALHEKYNKWVQLILKNIFSSCPNLLGWTMVSQSALPKGCDPATPTLKPPLRKGAPLTTQQKIAAATVKREQAKKNTVRRALASERAVKKPRSLAPPGERAQWGTEPSPAEKLPKKDELLTTQGKMRAAALKAAERDGGRATTAGEGDMAGFGSRDNSGKDKEKHSGKTPITAKKKKLVAEPLRMLKVIETHGSSQLRFGPRGKVEHPAVMSRRTRKGTRVLQCIRAKALADGRLKAMWESEDVQTMLVETQGFQDKIKAALKMMERNGILRAKVEKLVQRRLFPDPMTLEFTADDLQASAVKFRLLSLPLSVRKRIYEYAVVESEHFIYPDLPTGQEQPDLAMVSREIRAQMLPIFYGRNVFAVDLTVQPKGRSRAEGMTALTRWWRSLGHSGWFGIIRRWVFYHAPLTPAGQEDEDVMLSITFRTQGAGGAWDARVEVHRQASCVLAGQSCVVRQTPEWANKLVVRVCDAAKGRSVSGEMVLGFSEAVRGRMSELIDFRCTGA
ncbi:hypothetical protein LTR62_004617 [Meristemomyces frigidus]|uniref:Uncharacterized protein n=1 Tax=Meristemomyces frigidus TaxID=1508187 RepID=A0AAN7TEG4_9PEZI|nr:hypothetical protein LTR62_004617 [Meristemomyces frigidus]